MPGFDVVVAAEDDAAVRDLVARADAAFGWVPPEALPGAKKLRWLQSPFAAPFPGYYYEGLIEHPVVVTNARGIYSDHIAHHILMFMLALSRGLPYWMEAQRDRRWDQGARKRGYVNVAGSTVLINGVGGIGAETARLCVAMGAKVAGIDPRPEHDFPGEIHAPCALDDLLPDADFVVTTAPHTPETEFMWNADRFRSMKRSAYFINIGRGMTARLDDLTAALEDRAARGRGARRVRDSSPCPRSIRSGRWRTCCSHRTSRWPTRRTSPSGGTHCSRTTRAVSSSASRFATWWTRRAGTDTEAPGPGFWLLPFYAGRMNAPLPGGTTTSPVPRNTGFPRTYVASTRAPKRIPSYGLHFTSEVMFAASKVQGAGSTTMKSASPPGISAPLRGKSPK